MSDFDIDILSEDLNIFDRKKPIAVLRARRSQANVDSNDFLMHFGTKGMKWGVRRYTDEDGNLTELGRQRYGVEGTRSSFGTKRDLNKLDKEITRSQAKADRFRVKFEKKRSRKEYRAAKKGLEAPEVTEREQKIKNKSEAYQNLADRGRKFTESIINKTLKSGKSVYSKDVWRRINVGQTRLKTLLGTTLLSNSAGKGVMTREYAVGTKYKVRNDGRGARAHKTKKDRSMKLRSTIVV